MRRRPWPLNAEEDRVAAVAHIQSAREALKTIRATKTTPLSLDLIVLLADIQSDLSDAERYLTLAKFGERGLPAERSIR